MKRRLNRPELPLARIQQALGGDRRAQQDLVTCYGPAVRAGVAARVRQIPALHEQFEDIVAQVWLTVLQDPRHLRRYEPDKGTFGYFIRLVASNIAWRVLNREVRYLTRDDQRSTTPIDETLESHLFQREFLGRLWAKVRSSLTDVDLELFEAVLVQGHTIRDVAARLGKTDRSMYQRFSRMKKKISDLAEELLEDRVPEATSLDLSASILVVALTTTLAAQTSTTGGNRPQCWAFLPHAHDTEA